ncbi:MAG: hypothetical protein NPIRA01_01830 [Nitrospirales bacterium]|nr:MAG: hypothetical protein NPIRA01_01830 [Nitrospirales bacterium]
MKRDIIVIGASAGGVETLTYLFSQLHAPLEAAIAVVLHRHPFASVNLATVLGRHTSLEIIEATDNMSFQNDRIHLAPRDHHLLLDTQHILRLDHGPKQHFTRPSIDALFISAARHYRHRVIGLVMTGGGKDGTAGLNAINEHHGITLAQDPDEAPKPSMPRHAVFFDHVEQIVRVNEIPTALAEFTNRQGEAH